MDCSRKHAMQKDNKTGKFQSAAQASTLKKYDDAEVLYKNWTAELTKLVAAQNREDFLDRYRLSPGQTQTIGQATAAFHRQAKLSLSSNWNRLRDGGTRFWKPTESLQNDYNSL